MTDRRPCRVARVITSGLLGAPAVLTGACGGDCPTLETCDIRDTACQRETAEVAACLRGGDPASVPVTVVDADSFVERVVRESASADPTARDIDLGLSLVALAAPPEEQEQTLREYYDTVGAFYSPSDDAVTVLDRGYPLDGPGAVVLLLHEMIHAMQGADGSGSDDAYPLTYDGLMARSAMVEGDAVLYQDLATLDAYGRDRDVGWQGIFGQFQRRQWDAAQDDRSLHDLARRRFVYAFGGDYVNRSWRDGGNARVREVLSTPPTSTLEVLAGYEDAGAAVSDEPNDVGMPVLPSEFELLATRHLGAWLFSVWYASVVASAEQVSFDTETGFTGDVLTIFRNAATREIVTFWRLRFASPSHAVRLEDRLGRFPQLATRVIDSDVLIAATSFGAPWDWSSSELSWEPAPPEDFTAQSDAFASFLAGDAITCSIHSL